MDTNLLYAILSALSTGRQPSKQPGTGGGGMAQGMLAPENMSHADLLLARDKPGANQAVLAPAEHRAFAREWTQENPWIAAPSLAFAIPAYSAYKALGGGNARSGASWEELRQGYAGIADGLRSLGSP